VTNKGVGGLLKKWGEGASLIRKEWKAREENDEGGKEEGSGLVDMKGHRAGEDNGMAVDDDDDDDDDEDDQEEEEEEEEPDDLEATPRMLPRRTIGVNSPPSSLSSHADTHLNTDGSTANNNDLTNLTESLNSLSLVPNSIRFGRGGKSGGFLPRGRPRGRAGKHGRSDKGATGEGVMEVDFVPTGTGSTTVRGRGRGRGRVGRGRGMGATA
jgi:hypothetical protein